MRLIILVFLLSSCTNLPIKAEKSASLIHYKYEFGTRTHSIGGKAPYYWRKINDETYRDK